MDENILADNHVNVSPALVRIVDQTYSTPNITSVRVKHPELGNQAGIALIFGLIALVCFSRESYFWGVVLAGVAAAPFTQRSELIIATAGSERAALKASRARCNQVRDAIVRAMQLAARR